jgi:acetolactate synthase-1/3 small subunit
MAHYYTISCTTENGVGILQRLASICTRNRLNIEKLVAQEGGHGIAHVEVLFFCEQRVIDRVAYQLRKVVEVIELKVEQA